MVLPLERTLRERAPRPLLPPAHQPGPHLRTVLRPDLDPPTGEQLREAIRYEYERVGDLVHVDVKKLGRIPTGGGWRMHGQGSDAARASKRTGPGAGKVGYTYPHSARRSLRARLHRGQG
ncbi:hypothetical protein GCM10009579_70140 [Streptomyces javensis]|uniref:Uncharacterized protein n=1 Tax=Streptomyces javensis TaxID=114698 RepID=A0ABN1XBJ7_9ACTN